MGIGKDTLGQVNRLMAPLAKRLANSLARAAVQLIDDSKRMQTLQLGVLEGEDIDDAEHFQSYGFSSVPLAGAEAAVLFPNGERAHPIALAVTDRRYRPTGKQAGEVFLYTDEGDIIKLGRGHIVSIETTGEVRLGSASASQGAIKGTQRNTAEQTFLTALNAYAVAIQAVADPGNAATPTLTTAINAFASAVASAVSVKVKLE